MGRARKMTMDTIRLARGLVRNGGMDYPGWLPLYDRYPPPGVPHERRDKVPVIRFPQDRLADLFVERQGDVTDAETAYEFADEQLALIEQGIPEEQAYQILVKKYEAVDGRRLVSKLSDRLGIEHVDIREHTDLAEAWADMESELVKKALRKKFEEDAEIAKIQSQLAGSKRD